MDQATQVSFPTVVRNVEKKRIRRHNTMADLTHNSWTQNNRRPISLNFTNEMKNRINYVPTISEVTIRERTPPLNHTYKFLNKSRSQYLSDYECSSASATSLKCCCRCSDVENGNWKLKLTRETTPEGLSWRRLHMSRAKLKATATTSELLSGFAMVAMVELQINEPTSVPEWLFVVFAVCTTVLVAVHIFALMISTYILPNIDAIAKLEVCEMVAESPHERMRGFIELAWAFSTVLGLFLFLVEVAILCWVKFWDYSFTAAIAATVIVIPVLIIFILFAVHFYHSLVVHRCDTSISDMEKLEDMRKHLEEVSSSSA